jgi:hypothetical protein
MMRNSDSDGTTGETEGTSRTNKALGEPTSMRSYVAVKKAQDNVSG